MVFVIEIFLVSVKVESFQSLGNKYSSFFYIFTGLYFVIPHKMLSNTDFQSIDYFFLPPVSELPSSMI